jgi:hypothetical protein
MRRKSVRSPDLPETLIHDLALMKLQAVGCVGLDAGFAFRRHGAVSGVGGGA